MVEGISKEPESDTAAWLLINTRASMPKWKTACTVWGEKEKRFNATVRTCGERDKGNGAIEKEQDLQ